MESLVICTCDSDWFSCAFRSRAYLEACQCQNSEGWNDLHDRLIVQLAITSEITSGPRLAFNNTTEAVTELYVTRLARDLPR